MSKKINRKIKQYLKEINSLLPIKYAYVFGSYMNKHYDPLASDIDIAIFSNTINIKNRHDYTKMCIKSIFKYHLDIQPLLFNTRDLVATGNTFIEQEIKTRGHKI